MLIGENYIELEIVDSTNNYAQELLRKSHPTEGTLIFAGYQNGGIGQSGNSWVSEKNSNHLLSIILYPHFVHPEQLFLLVQTFSLGVADFLQQYLDHKNVRIKWPNDILIDNSKICGILINNNFEQNKIKSSIIGIGLNINQTVFPNEIVNPVSLKLLTGKNYDLTETRQELCKFLSNRYNQLLNNQSDIIVSDYTSLLYRFNELCSFQNSNKEEFIGKILGVLPDGRLKIFFNNKVLLFQFKEVSFV